MRLPVAEDDRIAIGRGTRDAAGADGARGPRRVFDDDRLAECPLHPIGEHARKRVGRPARWERHDNGDGSRRIGLCLRRERPGDRAAKRG